MKKILCALVMFLCAVSDGHSSFFGYRIEKNNGFNIPSAAVMFGKRDYNKLEEFVDITTQGFFEGLAIPLNDKEIREMKSIRVLQNELHGVDATLWFNIVGQQLGFFTASVFRN